MATSPGLEIQREAQSEALFQIVQQFQNLLGDDRVTAWDVAQPSLIAQADQAIAPSHHPACILYPHTPEELAEAVAYAHAHQWTVMPLGHGSKLHWGGLAKPINILVSTARLNRLIDHAVGDLTVTAEAGMGFADIQQHLQGEQQQLGLDPSFGDRATLGGIVATADTGSLRQRYGGVRDMLIGLSFVRADGQIAKAGGQVVKNVAGYDLMKLMTGAYGTLGIITQVTFRLYPIPPASQTILITGEAEAIATLADQIAVSTLTPTQFDLLSPALVQRLEIGKSMGLLLRFQSIAVSVEQQVSQVQAIAHSNDHSTDHSAETRSPSDATKLQTTLLDPDEEQNLWRRLRETMDSGPYSVPITCKIGVEPRHAAIALTHLEAALPAEAIGQLHRSSGSGTLRLEGEAIVPQAILKLRQICESYGGYLTLLEAPPSWKRQIDVWGYPGNALPLMQRIKQEFDPEHRLNPARFVGGI
ncbi:MAG: FAD-binding oxidoreductase [Elainellaceae cyanobacterium]